MTQVQLKIAQCPMEDVTSCVLQLVAVESVAVSLATSSALMARPALVCVCVCVCVCVRVWVWV